MMLHSVRSVATSMTWICIVVAGAVVAATVLATQAPTRDPPPPGGETDESVNAGGNVTRYGAKGDGTTDDTDAIQRAIDASSGAVAFPRGDYKITRTIEVDLAARGRIGLVGHGVGRIVMAGAGPALRFTGTHTGSADPVSVGVEVLANERMPLIEGLEIVGAHPEADGVEFVQVMQPTLAHVLIHDVRHGIRLVKRNRNLLVDSCHIYHCRGVGILFDRVNLHQAIIHGSHISYCKQGGIKILDGEIRNLQIVGNDIEYNHDPQAAASADIWIEVAEGSVREGTIVGNTIQALITPGGANIRLAGADDVNKVSMFKISGNHISNQEVNVHLKNCRGIVLTGNSIALSGQRNILVEGSRHIVIGPHSIDHNPDYELPVVDGITLRDCDGCSLNGVLVEGAKAGSEQEGGAIELFNCRDASLTSCQIFEPLHCGIYVTGCMRTMIANCIVRDRDEAKSMRAGVQVTGGSHATSLSNNVVDRGKLGDQVIETE